MNKMMTREEAIRYYDYINRTEDYGSKQAMAARIALTALRPLSREQVEKVWMGEWVPYLDGEHIMPERYYRCSKCGDRGYTRKRNFCPCCGAPMTDEAMDMVMERMVGEQE